MTSRRKPKRVAEILIFGGLCLFSAVAPAIEASNRYRSPRNPERKIRRSTELIVLHTTEAPARSSLNKLSDRGEAHYCVTEVGSIYRIVDRDREAFHAGRSMWRGREDVDKFSIGIECVGYHNKPMSSVQIAAIRELVAELKSMYGISDDRVVCHSHVAYGAPNRWQKRRHRGRKRCGMLFAMPSMRRALGLKSKPAYDADVRAGRLSIGDDYLHKILYGKVDTMAGRFSPPRKPAPKKTGWFSGFAGGNKTSGTGSAKAKVRSPSAAARRPAAVAAAPPRTVAELKARGYEIKGSISVKRTAIKIAGRKWNSPDTFYVINGKPVPGNRINASSLRQGTSIWMKR